ncbi:uncharacterized protein LOC142336192 isoform X2 [Convolutriloba macropyga]
MVVRIENRQISPVSGFDSLEPVTILHEELCYNESDGSYYIFIIDRLLGSNPLPEMLPGPSRHQTSNSALLDNNDDGTSNGDVTSGSSCEYKEGLKRDDYSPARKSTLQHSKSMPSIMHRIRFAEKSPSREEANGSVCDSRTFNGTSRDSSNDRRSGTIVGEPIKSAQWYRDLLCSERAYQMCLTGLDEEVETFNNSFVYFGEEQHNLLANIADHIQQIYNRCLQDFLDAKMIHSEAEQNQLCIAIESCIMDGVSGQLMRCVNDQLRDDMDRLCQLCDPFSQLSSDSLNIRPIYDCPLHHSISSLNQIRHSVTPDDILNRFQSTVRSVSLDVKEHARSCDPFSTSTPHVSADELVPLIARTIAQSQLHDVDKYLQIAQFFRFASAVNEGELTYALTTFHAAKQLIFQSFPNYVFSHSSQNISEANDIAQEQRARSKTTAESRKFKRHSLHFPNLPNPSHFAEESMKHHTDSTPRNSSLFADVDSIKISSGETSKFKLNTDTSKQDFPDVLTPEMKSQLQKRSNSVFVMPAAIEIPEMKTMLASARTKKSSKETPQKQPQPILKKQYTYSGTDAQSSSYSRSNKSRRQKISLPSDINSKRGQNRNSNGVTFEHMHNDPLFLPSAD